MSKYNQQKEDLKEALNKPKQIDEILEEQIETAMHEHNRSGQDLFLSAISAGLEIGFSVFLMASLYTLLNEIIHPSVLHILLALAYPLGFIFVVIGRSELFTEHTTLAVIPVLNKNATVKSLLSLWGIIYAGNILGGYFFAYILSILPERFDFVSEESFVFLAQKIVDHPWHSIFISATLAGWLMGLLSWLITSSQDTISRIVLVALITTVIGIGGLHHSIVGSIEVFVAFILEKTITLKNYLHFQLWTTIGNMIGGVFFVAFVKFSHVNPRRKHL